MAGDRTILPVPDLSDMLRLQEEANRDMREITGIDSRVMTKTEIDQRMQAFYARVRDGEMQVLTPAIKALWKTLDK